MKFSLIGIALCCAVTSSAFAGSPATPVLATDLPGVNPPRATLADLPGVNPPRATLADLPGVNPPRATLADLPGVNPPRRV